MVCTKSSSLRPRGLIEEYFIIWDKFKSQWLIQILIQPDAVQVCQTTWQLCDNTHHPYPAQPEVAEFKLWMCKQFRSNKSFSFSDWTTSGLVILNAATVRVFHYLTAPLQSPLPLANWNRQLSEVKRVHKNRPLFVMAKLVSPLYFLFLFVQKVDNEPHEEHH